MKRLLVILVPLLLLGAGGFFYWFTAAPDEVSLSVEKIEKPQGTRSVTRVEGIALSQSLEGRPYFSLKAEHLTVKPLDLGGFKVRTVSEGLLSRVEVSVEQWSELPKEKIDLNDLLPLRTAINAMREGGKASPLSRMAKLKLLQFRAQVNRDGRLYRVVKAAKASVDMKSGKITLRDVELEAPGQKIFVRSKSAEWLPDRKMFYLPESYSYRDAGHHERGLNAMLTPEFKLESLGPKPAQGK